MIRRRIVALLAIVGATVGLAWSQTGHAFVMDGQRNQCEDNVRAPVLSRGLWSGGGGYNGFHSDGYKSGGGLSNDAEQCNGTLYQKAYNKPKAYVFNKNFNIAPQIALLGVNRQWNDQSNSTAIDQSQHAKAVQSNSALQGIWANWGPPGGYVNGGGPPVENDADQSNRELSQRAYNKPKAYVFNKNFNLSPQIALLGSNSQDNTQSNSTAIDQSQEAKAGQFNVAGQEIGLGAPIDPVNDADQSNGFLSQEAKKEPKSVVGNGNFNVAPQIALLGHNSQTNDQSNSTAVDQSQQAGAAQGNVVGQLLQL